MTTSSCTARTGTSQKQDPRRRCSAECCGGMTSRTANETTHVDTARRSPGSSALSDGRRRFARWVLSVINPHDGRREVPVAAPTGRSRTADRRSTRLQRVQCVAGGRRRTAALGKRIRNAVSGTAHPAHGLVDLPGIRHRAPAPAASGDHTDRPTREVRRRGRSRCRPRARSGALVAGRCRFGSVRPGVATSVLAVYFAACWSNLVQDSVRFVAVSCQMPALAVASDSMWLLCSLGFLALTFTGIDGSIEMVLAGVGGRGSVGYRWHGELACCSASAPRGPLVAHQSPVRKSTRRRCARWCSRRHAVTSAARSNRRRRGARRSAWRVRAARPHECRDRGRLPGVHTRLGAPHERRAGDSFTRSCVWASGSRLRG